MAKGKTRRHPLFGATKKTGEQNARQRDRQNIDFLTGEVDKIRRSVDGLQVVVDRLLKRTGGAL